MLFFELVSERARLTTDFSNKFHCHRYILMIPIRWQLLGCQFPTFLSLYSVGDDWPPSPLRFYWPPCNSLRLSPPPTLSAISSHLTDSSSFSPRNHQIRTSPLVYAYCCFSRLRYIQLLKLFQARLILFPLWPQDWKCVPHRFFMPCLLASIPSADIVYCAFRWFSRHVCAHKENHVGFHLFIR